MHLTLLQIITVCLLICGIVVMVLASSITMRLLQLLKEGKYAGAWKFMYILIMMFQFGYVFTIILTVFFPASLINLIAGIVFLLGSLFVFVVMRVSEKTIRQLFATTVSKDFIENIVQSMADTLIVVNLSPDGTITEVNEATLRMLGYNREELIGESINIILDTEHLDPNEEISNNQHVTYRTKTGDEIPVLYSRSKMSGIDNSHSGYIYVGQDISKIVRAERAIKKSEHRYRFLAEQLEESNTLKELLLDIITHDLKNPVGVIQGMSDLLVQESPDNELITGIRDSSENILKVINNATVLSKLAIGEKLEMEPIDVSNLMKEAVDNFKLALESNDMTVEDTLSSPVIIEGHPVLVEVFKNYVSNAVKYAKVGKKIIIGTEKSDRYLRCFVKDIGKTIPRQLSDKIFDRKVQLENGLGKGTGLGLAIVKRIADEHDAVVGTVPNEPTGNIFYIDFPLGKLIKP
ncbi:MAG: PAS domain S-box protein [Candidatus Marinimicrobia bacterium]|nr:PAS domain S-box protein [Candidatus Neomarinimicrobiota bacterium]